MREETINDGRLCWREQPNLFWTDYSKEELTLKYQQLLLNQNINGVLTPYEQVPWYFNPQAPILKPSC